MEKPKQSKKKDAGNWRAETGKSKWPNTGIVQDFLARLNRKPGERQYIAVLRRKGSDKMQTTRKRHRFQTFIGLMGKRSSYNEGRL
ncbi:uncharacterized protein ACNS7B_018465 isoform 2-T2 [Menidia menidia]